MCPENEHWRESDRNWGRVESCSVDELDAARSPSRHFGCVFATAAVADVPIYDCSALATALQRPADRLRVMDEWIQVLADGPGVLVLKHAFAELDAVDQATSVFEAIIDDERAAGGAEADHFAQAGTNDRIWNALEKLARRAPDIFARYYRNASIALIAEAWLGPAYQVTSQVNVVRPGGAAQTVHRDYHLGFQDASVAERYPRHVHRASPFLTLQGAIAHRDMPLESGPTKLLPFSQRYVWGYLAWRRPEFQAYFENNCVQVPLDKGDALFFNPALFHAAGANRTASVFRMANLLQISSAYGRAMESVNRRALCEALYPILMRDLAAGVLDWSQAERVIAASAEGYPFPTDLDRDPPIDGLAPPSQQSIFRHALDEAWPRDRFVRALAEHAARRAA